MSITLPFRDAGLYQSREPDAPLVIRNSYFERRPFGRWAYPLSMYTHVFEDAGFLIQAMREPPDPRRSVPNFLLIRAVKA